MAWKDWKRHPNKLHRILKIEQWLNERTYMKNPEIPRDAEMYLWKKKKLRLEEYNRKAVGGSEVKTEGSADKSV